MGQFVIDALKSNDQTFSPNADLTKKQNYCRHVFIERDGSVVEVVRLNILNDRDREQIIAFHFCQQFAKVQYGDQEEQPQFYVVGRDCPWDFEYVLHDGTSFFLEICRVADEALLKAIKAENDAMQLLRKGRLKRHEALKIEKLFPGTLPASLVAKAQSKAAKEEIFLLDDQKQRPNLFLRPPMVPEVDLIDALRNAITKKIEKRHTAKERTILVLDNLTMYASPERFHEAIEVLQDYLNTAPFLSIWLYTGYYSGDDGYNAEFSLMPIKCSDRELEILTGLTQHGTLS